MAAFLQKNGWILPLAFALLLGVVGSLSYRTLQASAKRELSEDLAMVRDTALNAIQIWAEDKRAQAEVHASDPLVVESTRELMRVARSAEDPRAALAAAPALQRMRDRLAVAREKYRYLGFASATPGGMIVSSGRDVSLAGRAEGLTRILPQVLGGETILTRPLRPELLGPASQLGEPLMIAAAPMRDATGKPFALFGFSLRPADSFTRILKAARGGETGESYAFDRDGRMLTPSRFHLQLVELGLVVADQTEVMNVQIRDPGGNLAEGFTPTLPLEARAFTKAAADALAGNTGVDVEGYPDYRGVPVLGAWAWIPELEIGVASEVDLEEAYAPLYTLRNTFAGVMGLLVLAALGMFLYSYLAARLSRQMDQVRQLGRYRIESKIGKGGMGTVYLARHALLRRPTAVKVLNAERKEKGGVARFEREVQITSSLRHPNTVEIYDYGYTDDDTFYYAMEFLEGIDLGDCVQNDGPQPEARVLHIMRQACGSIAEAHATGLIHRDIKPANIMLCDRGGLLDFVKVLDFGLVRHEQQSKDTALTDEQTLTGTPLYMPPEAVRSPESLDARGDVYQLGQVAYYLLVGRHLFTADSAMDVMLKHVSETPEPPSKVLVKPVSEELEKVILSCLEKDPKDRPANAGELLQAFERCRVAGSWGQAEARAWWAAWHAREPAEAGAEATSTGTLPSGIAMAERTVPTERES